MRVIKQFDPIHRHTGKFIEMPDCLLHLFLLMFGCIELQIKLCFGIFLGHFHQFAAVPFLRLHDWDADHFGNTADIHFLRQNKFRSTGMILIILDQK